MKHNDGFSLVELMVSILISMLIIVVVFGTAKFVENQKRQLVGTNGALETLSITTQIIANDIRMAGLGMTYEGDFSCKTASIRKNDVLAATDEDGFIPPISWTDGGEGLSDSIRVVYADSVLGGAITTVKTEISNFGQPIYNNANGDSTVVDYAMPFVPDENPELSITAAMTNTNGHCQIVGFDNKNGISPIPDSTIPAGATAMPINDFRDVTYSVKNNTLWMHDNFVKGPSGDMEIASDIVYMKIQGLIKGSWFSAADSAVFHSKSPLSSQFNNTSPSAIKLFLIARVQNINAKKNGVCTATTKESLEQAMPWYTGFGALYPAVDLSNTGNWQCYKYKGIELIIPLRNLSIGAQNG